MSQAAHSRRESQIMEILYTNGPSTVAGITSRNRSDGLLRGGFINCKAFGVTESDCLIIADRATDTMRSAEQTEIPGFLSIPSPCDVQMGTVPRF